eukprot:TRINITY_DN4028_c0_g1_i2.p1 TRINITY_DN4028_c0_g1~~TRINITY_DN4028_c0_g1_i2.p1  ORF type:complete len:466 (+),score=193.42 TRINITY_DN4028_c0_g1_i2:274-1671(+)
MNTAQLHQYYSHHSELVSQIRRNTETAKQTIESISKNYREFEIAYDNLFRLQIEFFSKQSTEIPTYESLLNEIDINFKKLNGICESLILEPEELNNTRVLLQKLNILKSKIDVLQKEFKEFESNQIPKTSSLDIIITEQPISQVIFKGKIIEDTYEVQLLKGVATEIRSMSRIKAKLSSEETTWRTDNLLENDDAVMNSNIASFQGLKINVSTRMSTVFLKFSATFQTTKDEKSITSIPSNPIIVITNESQWCEAAGKLLLHDAFKNLVEIPWFEFANCLHHHFLKATRQEYLKITRALGAKDFHYIYTKFFNSSTITQQQVGAFWNWFGQVTQALRFKRHISALWFNGLIYGIISKDECALLLSDQLFGTFMIRFSETFPGLFAVAYVSDDINERVKHYLVKPDDTGSQKTLPDFIREKPQFQNIYQLQDVGTGEMRSFYKDLALGNYYSKKRIQANDNGYVQL